MPHCFVESLILSFYYQLKLLKCWLATDIFVAKLKLQSSNITMYIWYELEKLLERLMIALLMQWALSHIPQLHCLNHIRCNMIISVIINTVSSKHFLSFNWLSLIIFMNIFLGLGDLIVLFEVFSLAQHCQSHNQKPDHEQEKTSKQNVESLLQLIISLILSSLRKIFKIIIVLFEILPRLQQLPTASCSSQGNLHTRLSSLDSCSSVQAPELCDHCQESWSWRCWWSPRAVFHRPQSIKVNINHFLSQQQPFC